MKKIYMQPSVEAAQLQMNSMVLAGSGETGINISSDPGENITGD